MENADPPQPGRNGARSPLLNLLKQPLFWTIGATYAISQVAVPFITSRTEWPSFELIFLIPVLILQPKGGYKIHDAPNVKTKTVLAAGFFWVLVLCRIDVAEIFLLSLWTILSQLIPCRFIPLRRDRMSTIFISTWSLFLLYLGYLRLVHAPVPWDAPFIDILIGSTRIAKYSWLVSFYKTDLHWPFYSADLLETRPRPLRNLLDFFFLRNPQHTPEALDQAEDRNAEAETPAGGMQGVRERSNLIRFQEIDWDLVGGRFRKVLFGMNLLGCVIVGCLTAKTLNSVKIPLPLVHPVTHSWTIWTNMSQTTPEAIFEAGLKDLVHDTLMRIGFQSEYSKVEAGIMEVIELVQTNLDEEDWLKLVNDLQMVASYSHMKKQSIITMNVYGKEFGSTQNILEDFTNGTGTSGDINISADAAAGAKIFFDDFNIDVEAEQTNTPEAEIPPLLPGQMSADAHMRKSAERLNDSIAILTLMLEQPLLQHARSEQTLKTMAAGLELQAKLLETQIIEASDTREKIDLSMTQLYTGLSNITTSITSTQAALASYAAKPILNRWLSRAPAPTPDVSHLARRLRHPTDSLSHASRRADSALQSIAETASAILSTTAARGPLPRRDAAGRPKMLTMWVRALLHRWTPAHEELWSHGLAALDASIGAAHASLSLARKELGLTAARAGCVADTMRAMKAEEHGDEDDESESAVDIFSGRDILPLPPRLRFNKTLLMDLKRASFSLGYVQAAKERVEVESVGEMKGVLEAAGQKEREKWSR